MAGARKGDRVRVHYEGRLTGGEVFDSSRQREPLELVIGEGTTLFGFEDALVGLSPGQTATVEIPCRKAYGPHSKNMERVLRRDLLPQGKKVAVGQRLRIELEKGSPAVVTVIHVSGRDVIVDLNHPLAGQDLIFDIELLEILS